MSISGDASEGGRRTPGRGAGLGAEISRRVAAILDAVEAEAAQVKAEARAEAEAELERARRQAEELLEERRRRIAELSDELVAKTEAIVGRLDDAEPIHRRFELLIGALGEAAEKLAAEAGQAHTAETPNESGPATPPPEPVPTPTESPDADVYVAPRSSSFWRAAQAGGTAPTAPRGGMPIPGPDEWPSERPEATPGPDLDAARAAAFQLAARGASREEVSEHLRLIHELDDPQEVLAEAFAAARQHGSRRGRT